MEIFKQQFLDKASNLAERAAHPFPRYAAAEAALESAFGTSGLCKLYNNPLGMKCHQHNEYDSVMLPTKEFIDADHDGKPEWVTVQASFERYPSLQEAFLDRLHTLQRLAHVYPHYAAALAAKDGETFVREVSASWSTDPARAQKCIAIHDQRWGAPAPKAAAATA